MTEVLRGNDVAVTWTLPTRTDNNDYKDGNLFVYGGNVREEVEYNRSSNIIQATIAGNLLPLGIYSLEFLFSYEIAQGKSKIRKYGRVKAGQILSITEDEDDVLSSITIDSNGSGT